MERQEFLTSVHNREEQMASFVSHLIAKDKRPHFCFVAFLTFEKQTKLMYSSIMCQEGGEAPPKGQHCNIMLPAESCHLPCSICIWSIDGLITGKRFSTNSIRYF
jgi:hypothetical protein